MQFKFLDKISVSLLTTFGKCPKITIIVDSFDPICGPDTDCVLTKMMSDFGPVLDRVTMFEK